MSAPNAAELKRDKEARAYRKARRKAREAAGEIKELNITAMMDMMTIILVFLLKSYSASSLTIDTQKGILEVPASTTQQKPQDNINVTVSQLEISVGDHLVMKLNSGVIPAAGKAAGAEEGLFLADVYASLKKEVDKQKYIAKYNPNMPFTGRVNIVADKHVPYKTLMAVLHTAGQAELGEFKFMVLKND